MPISLSAQPQFASGSPVTLASIQKVEFYDQSFTKIGSSITTPDGQGRFNLTLNTLHPRQYNFSAVAFTANGAIESPVSVNWVYPAIQFNSVTPDLNVNTIDPQWDTINPNYISNALAGNPSSLDRSSFWKARYDTSNLFFYFRINDSPVIRDGLGDFNDDTIEIYLSPTNNSTSSMLASDRAIIIDVVNGTASELGSRSITGTAIKTVQQQGFYTVLVRIPFTVLGINPTTTLLNNVNVDIGVDIQVNDDDNAGTRDNQTAWFNTLGAFNNPSRWGDARLLARPSAVTRTISVNSPTANTRIARNTPFNIISVVAPDVPTKVEFFVDNIKVGEKSTADPGNSFSFSYTNNIVGSKTLTSRATFSDNTTLTSAPVTIIISEPNLVNITQPTGSSNLTLGSSIDITATTIENIADTQSVEFYINQNPGAPPVAVVTTPLSGNTYRYTWTPPLTGIYNIYVIASFVDGSSAQSGVSVVTVASVSTGGGGTGSNNPNGFTITGDRIIGPNGVQFISKGIRVPGQNWTSTRSTLEDVNLIDRVWGFNTVFLDCYVRSITGSQSINNDLNAIITSFTDRGIVVIISANDLPGSYPTDVSTPNLDEIATFFRNLSATYRNNPFVWYNPLARPGGVGVVNSQWVAAHQAIIQEIRTSSNNPHPIICNGSAFGQDLGVAGSSTIVTANSAILSASANSVTSFNGITYNNIGYGLSIGDQWVGNTENKLKDFIAQAELANRYILITHVYSRYNNTDLSSITVPVKNALDFSSSGRTIGFWMNNLTTVSPFSGNTINRKTGGQPTNLSVYGNLIWNDNRNILQPSVTEPTAPGATGQADLVISSVSLEGSSYVPGATARVNVVVRNIGTASSALQYMGYVILVNEQPVDNAGRVVSIAPNEQVTLVSNGFEAPPRIKSIQALRI